MFYGLDDLGFIDQRIEIRSGIFEQIARNQTMLKKSIPESELLEANSPLRGDF